MPQPSLTFLNASFATRLSLPLLTYRVAAGFHSPADDQDPKKVLRVYLKYGPDGERVIRHVERVSKPGCRIYRSYRDLPPVLDGLGISIISTSRGVMSDRQARAQRLGGEVLCNVW